MKRMLLVMWRDLLQLIEYLGLYKSQQTKRLEEAKRRHVICQLLMEEGMSSLSDHTLHYLHYGNDEDITETDLMPWHQQNRNEE